MLYGKNNEYKVRSSLYTTVVKSICLPLESIELAVTEGESWTQPEDLSDEYDQAKEQLNKTKVRVLLSYYCYKIYC
jgi:hypothetical protein